jgi:sugar phosphate isomerase/epimerase
MSRSTRRDFLKTPLGLGAAAVLASPLAQQIARAADHPGANLAFGMVTYIWGKDEDLPTLLGLLAKARVFGVELRTERAHKVEPTLSPAERAEVKKRFADSPVTLVGLGSAEAFHYPDPKALAKAIERTKAFIKLSHDVGGSGVKVRPNDLPKSVPQEKTIEQIGQAMNTVAAFGADYGQQVRLEVHGACSPLPIIKRIMDVADHPNATVCWNSNGADLQGEGLEANFNLVRKRFGATVHVRRLESKDYPFEDLIRLLVKTHYKGWVLMEAHDTPKDLVAALAEQRELFERMVAKARA